MTGAPEVRGTWVSHDSIQTAAGRSSMIERMNHANLNTVLVIAPPINGNYGISSIEAFGAFTSACADAGFAVFGWIPNHKRTYPDVVDFRVTGEKEAQAKWVRDILVEYPDLDGMAIDYIRYSTWEESDFTKNVAVTETIESIRSVTDELNKALISTCFPAATVTYRGSKSGGWQGGVPEWYRNWYAANWNNYFTLEATNGGTGVVNRANIGSPNPDFYLGPSFMSYQQDPITWMKLGNVDDIVPMQYTADVQVMKNEIDLWQSFSASIGKDLSSIHLGLGWMDEPTSFPDSKFDPSAMVAHVRYGREKGVGGYTIFRLGIPGIDDCPLIDALTVPNEDNGNDPPFAEVVPSPFGGTGVKGRQGGFVCENQIIQRQQQQETSAAPMRGGDLQGIANFVLLFALLCWSVRRGL